MTRTAHAADPSGSLVEPAPRLLAPHAPDPVRAPLDRDGHRGRVHGEGLADPVPFVFDVVSAEAGLVIPGWSDASGQRRVRPTVAVAPDWDPWPESAASSPTTRSSTDSHLLGARVAGTTAATGATTSTREPGANSRNRERAAGLASQGTLIERAPRPPRAEEPALRSPWTLRADGEDPGSEEALAGRNGAVEPLASDASARRERALGISAPRGYEVLEVEFGAEAEHDDWLPFLAGRRQDDDAACSAFGRELQGMAGVQFAAGDGWRCRVQVSQSFVDAVSERQLRPALSVSVRRRF